MPTPQTRPTQQRAPSVQERPPQTTNALARVTGTFMAPGQVNERLQLAAAEFNLITPSTAAGVLPEGCGIALSAVVVDVQNESFSVGSGKRALLKSALDKIAASIGVSWIPGECRRIDDGSDPHYVHFSVAGRYRAFDGQTQVITANKEMDVRDGSPMYVEIEAQARRDKRDPIAQIRQLRAHILAHAESKAKNRAIRSLGVRSSYSPDELQKPFICARIMFTGATADPELKRLFAAKTADAFLSGTHTLYGGAQAHPSRQIEAHAPPPIGDRAEAEDDGPYHEAEPIDAQDEEPPPHDDPPPPPPRERKRSEPPPAPASPRAASQFTVPGGRNKGTPLHKASDADLQYWADRIGRDLDAGQSRDAQRDSELHAALCDEIASREHEYDRQQELRT